MLADFLDADISLRAREDDLHAELENRLALEREHHSGLVPTARIVHGKPAPALLDLCCESGAGRSWWARTQLLLHHAPCPVALIRS